MRFSSSAAFAIAFLVASPLAAKASSLQVSPISLQVSAPGAATSFELANEGPAPISAQIRVYRWTQQGGGELLTPTDAVAASPPSATLAPNARYTIRVIRLDPAPVEGEESYRVVVDELPDAARARNGAIAIVVRYSLPLFFTAPAASAPQLSWRAQKQSKHVALIATNEGDRHLRLSSMKAKDGAAGVAGFGEGLAGYVLGHASMRFLSKAQTNGFMGGAATVKADSDLGQVNAVAPITK